MAVFIYKSVVRSRIPRNVDMTCTAPPIDSEAKFDTTCGDEFQMKHMIREVLARELCGQDSENDSRTLAERHGASEAAVPEPSLMAPPGSGTS
jgi:hypothetical protein